MYGKRDATRRDLANDFIEEFANLVETEHGLLLIKIRW
jgi:hypothetical protein